MSIELVFIIGVAILLFLCVKVKTNAFIALIATAAIMGLLAGLSGAETVKAITTGFARTVRSIGIVIIPLVVPLLLIVSNTTCAMLLPKDSQVLKITPFVGDANVALAIGAVLAIITLGNIFMALGGLFATYLCSLWL